MNKNKLIADNIFITVISLLFIAISFFELGYAYYIIVAICFMVIAIFAIFRAYSIEHNLLNYYNCYYFIWLFLIPLTSFSFPVMDPMTPIVWRFCLAGNCCFSISIIGSLLIKIDTFKSPLLRSFNQTILKTVYI